MSKKKDITGKKFGRLTAVSSISIKQRLHWDCLCECGRRTVVNGSVLRSGHTQSCGCLNKDIITTHGHSKEPYYFVWQAIIARTTRKTDKRYKNYGGRGIKVCDRWMKFENFWADMKNEYKKGLYIERLDNDGDYEPENCKWTTMLEQAKNRRNNVWLTANGRTMIRGDWATELGIKHYTLDWFIKKGNTMEDALIYYKKKGE